MRTRAVLSLLLLSVLFTGCAKHKKIWHTPPPPGVYVETGTASWYGYPYDGRRTSSGEVYDMEKLTAAHRTLPFNTWIRVQNLSNHREVDVKINDRGPFAHGRIIDLSRAAARRIEMIGPGTVKVRLVSIRAPAREEPVARTEPVPAENRRPSPFSESPPPAQEMPPAPEMPPPEPATPPAAPATPPPSSVPAEAPAPSELFGVQVGAFADRERAEQLRGELERRYGKARLVEKTGTPTMWRVVAGECADADAASALAQELRKDFPGAYVTRVDQK
ncbi:MAG: septal ring lytic transglycosylase RlpA family protein [Acidobacteriales bacterium]|nr:septal ring lytic transglycosylase RlpA family protein [Terriglobales bacterium]